MKQITFYASTLLLSLTLTAQNTVENVTTEPYETVVFTQTQNAFAPCSQEETSNGFESGFGNTVATIEVADDIVVPAGETFTLEAFTFNLISTGDVPDVTLRIYENQDGLPGTNLLDVVVAPTSSEVVGSAFGRDVQRIRLDLGEPFLLNGAPDADTNYWIGIWTPNGTGADAFYETTSASDSEVLVAFRDGSDTANPWNNMFDPGDGTLVPIGPATVFLAEGDCDVLSVNASELSSISVSPNPATTVLNIALPNSVNVKNVAVYDILGKKSNIALVDNRIDVSNLSSGLYILRMTTDAGTLTRKIIKK